MLLKKGADVQISGDNMILPLHWAAGHGHLEIVKMLLTHEKIDISARTAKGETALHCAVMNKHDDIAKILNPDISIHREGDKAYVVTPVKEKAIKKKSQVHIIV